MTVTLLPPISSGYLGFGPRPVPVMEGPRFVRTRNMTRWHRPRHARHYPDRDYTAFHLWCGQGVFSHRMLGRDADPDDGLPVCGSCEGRAIGAGHEDNDGPRELTFVPRWLFPPKNCPGSGTDLFEPIPDSRGYPRGGICLACAATVPIRAMGGIYRSRIGIIQHEALDLVEPCPFHAWMYLGLVDGDIGCYGCTVNVSDGAA